MGVEAEVETSGSSEDKGAAEREPRLARRRRPRGSVPNTEGQINTQRAYEAAIVCAGNKGARFTIDDFKRAYEGTTRRRVAKWNDPAWLRQRAAELEAQARAAVPTAPAPTGAGPTSNAAGSTVSSGHGPSGAVALGTSPTPPLPQATPLFPARPPGWGGSVSGPGAPGAGEKRH